MFVIEDQWRHTSAVLLSQNHVVLYKLDNETHNNDIHDVKYTKRGNCKTSFVNDIACSAVLYTFL